jgi:hypothetical protein
VKPKPKFTITTLLLLTALIAVGLSHCKTSRELSHVRSELTALRNDLAVLDVKDESQIHAIALPTYGPMQWRWRVQLPDEGTYRLRYSFEQIPVSGLPSTSTSDDHAFIDQYAKPLAGATPFLFSLGIFEDAKGRWQIKTDVRGRGSTRPIEDPPGWLNAGSFVNWSVNVLGNNKTVTADNDRELILLKYRKGKRVPGGVTVDTQPTDGMMFWIERIDKP